MVFTVVIDAGVDDAVVENSGVSVSMDRRCRAGRDVVFEPSFASVG